jgi:hypothetical protein
MRGKLRDKSFINRRDVLRRPDGEPYKRDARGTQWIGQQLDEDDDEYDFEEELALDDEEDLEADPVPLKETQKK